MKRKVNAKEIQGAYNFLESLAKKSYSKERYERTLKLFEYFQDRMITAPASYKEDYHNAFDGGWLLHTVNVVKNSLDLYEIWKKVQETSVKEIKISEIIFAAMFHDLGKLGDLEESYYIKQKSAWHRKRGMMYDFNPKLKGYMKTGLRSLYILQHFGFKLSKNEFLSIKLSNGMFEKGNKPYYYNLESNLPIIIHHADHMAVRIEKNRAEEENKSATEKFKKELFNK